MQLFSARAAELLQGIHRRDAIQGLRYIAKGFIRREIGFDDYAHNFFRGVDYIGC